MCKNATWKFGSECLMHVRKNTVRRLLRLKKTISKIEKFAVNKKDK